MSVVENPMTGPGAAPGAEPNTDQPMTENRGRPETKLSAGQWVGQNLFNNWYNALLTIVFLGVAGVIAFYSLRFLLFTSQWRPVQVNLTLLMIGTFPRSEQWRIVAQFLLLAGASGIFWGAFLSGARDRAARTGTAFKVEKVAAVLRRWWALLLLLAVLLVLTRTFLPLVFTLLTLATLFIMRWLVSHINTRWRPAAWIVGYLLLIASWQIVNGTGGSGWWWLAGLLAYLGTRVPTLLVDRFPNNQWLPKGYARFLVQLATIAAATVAARLIYIPLDFSGIGWDNWSGFHLNLVATVIGIVAAFPLGIMLALGRNSKLKGIKWMSVTYIELVRGVPLIGLLFVGNTLFGFLVDIEAKINPATGKTENPFFVLDWFDSIFEFFRDPSDPLSQITRAIAVITLFSAAYLAEIIRGGLQALPRGQIEAGQAVGLSAVQTTRLILVPQAIVSVIPSLVTQFINLLKDSTLLWIISVPEVLRIRTVLHQQQEFMVLGIAETLVFISFAFWAISYTMSRESQRLERQLGLGER